MGRGGLPVQTAERAAHGVLLAIAVAQKESHGASLSKPEIFRVICL